MHLQGSLEYSSGVTWAWKSDIPAQNHSVEKKPNTFSEYSISHTRAGLMLCSAALRGEQNNQGLATK